MEKDRETGLTSDWADKADNGSEITENPIRFQSCVL